MDDTPNSTVKRFEWDAVPPSVAVVETVSDVTNVDPIDLPTLNDTIDTDALDALCTGEKRDMADITLSFMYAGCEVTVIGEGTVIVEAVEPPQTRG